jgi:hypothetical protein
LRDAAHTLTEAPAPSRQRSALSNGTRLFLGKVDNRSTLARRLADLIRDAEAERGGPGAMTVTQRAAVRAFAMLCVEREAMETARAAGEPFDAELYGQLADRMDRQARRMGPPLKQQPRSLEERLAARRAGERR